MKNKFLILLLALSCSVNFSYSQTVKQDIVADKHFIGTSLWSIANLFPDPGDFYELDYGYRITSKDAIVIQAITWKYHRPIGIPFGASYESAEVEYPGYVRSFGIGIGYQRYLWKGLFTTIHATPFLQNFYDMEKTRIETGFQLYLQAQAGYHIKLFRNRCYLEPSLTFNYWPVNTNFPDPFQQFENRWPNYFLFEPHLNFGVNF